MRALRSAVVGRQMRHPPLELVVELDRESDQRLRQQRRKRTTLAHAMRTRSDRASPPASVIGGGSACALLDAVS